MIATAPERDAIWEICRVYVSPGQHGSGLGAALLQTAERYARTAGATAFVLWTDTRFERAHRFYEKHGYVRQAGTFPLNDLANTVEYVYRKPA